MKTKRWKCRNRHTRPEWVKAYRMSDWLNLRESKRYHKGFTDKLIYFYPYADWLTKSSGLPNFRGEFEITNLPPQHLHNQKWER